MKRRLIMAHRHQNLFRFAVPKPNQTFLQEMSSGFDLDAFAEKFALKRLKDFDWAVGDAGRQACLFQAQQEQSAFEIENKLLQVEWLSFPFAAKKLQTGEDKRFLQLAVQFLSAGSVLHDVDAAEYDKGTLDEISKEILGVGINDLKKS